MKLSTEPVVIANAVAGVLLVLGIELAGDDLDLLTRVLAVAVPVVAGLVARTFTRSKASLRAQSTPGTPGV